MSSIESYIQLTVAIITGILVSAILYVWRKWTYWDRHGVPNTGPFAQFFALKGRQITDVEMEWLNKYGRVYGIYSMFTPILVVGDPENVKSITIKDFSNFRNHAIFNKIERRMDLNVFILRDDYWKKMRGIVSPVFSAAKLKVVSDTINPCIDNFIKNIIKAGKTSESTLSMKTYFGCLTMDVIVSFAYGSKIDCLNEPNNEIVVRAAQIFQTVAGSFGIFGARFLDLSCFDYFSKLTLDLVSQRRKENLAGIGEKRADFLQVLTDAKYNKDGPSLSDDEICAFGLSFFSDGYETTANALTAITYYLATNEIVQEKLYQEVCQLSDVNADTVNALPYLDAVVKEAFRLWPGGTRTDRMAEDDYTLEGTNITIKSGMVVHIPIYAMLRDPETYPDPDEFKPERFLPGGQNQETNPLGNLTFGAGPRSCVAQRFATLQIKLTITKTIQKVKFLSTPETKLENEDGVVFIFFPKDMYVKVLPR